MFSYRWEVYDSSLETDPMTSSETNSKTSSNNSMVSFDKIPNDDGFQISTEGRVHITLLL